MPFGHSHLLPRGYARRTAALSNRDADRVQVGVIASKDQRDEERWWKEPAKGADVIDESIAYLYAAFSFGPSRKQADGELPVPCVP